MSSDKQDVALSISAQLRALREYAAKNGHVVVAGYVDEAESGRTADRPQFHSSRVERKAFIKSFVQEIVVSGRKAVLRYTLPLPSI